METATATAERTTDAGMPQAPRRRWQARPNKDLVLQREVTAWTLRCQGWTHAQIAEQIGISRRAVGLILDRVRDRETTRLSAAVEQHLRAELAGR